MTLRVTAAAKQRLFDIWERIRDDSSGQLADKIEQRLLDRAFELLNNPLKGPPEPGLTVLRKGHRYLLLGRYKIIYRVIEDVVHVTDFFATKQHPSRMRG